MLIALVVCGTYWRLTQGPISLAFVKEPFENILNSRIGDMRIQIRDAVLERNDDTGAVNFRLRGLQVANQQGEVIARTPRAAVGLSSSAILKGEIVPARLELIGPRIRFSRQADGSLRLGFSEDDSGAAAPEPELRRQQDANAEGSDAPEAGSSDTDDSAESSVTEIVNTVLEAFSEKAGSGSMASFLEHIAVRDAVMTLHDENNKELWQAPNANLDLRRVDDGVSLVGDIKIDGAKIPWQMELLANYKKRDDKFTVVARVTDFIPAEIAGKLSVLSNFAQARLPLSGRISLEVDRKGNLTSGDAHLSAGAGHVGFPGVVGVPVLIDEGQVNLRLDVATKNVLIEKSSLVIAGVQTELNGIFIPEIGEGGLGALGFSVAADTTKNQNTEVKPVLDVFKLAGRADVADRKVEISELVILAGKAQIVMNGLVTEGEGDLPGIKIRGALENLPFATLKKIWPPLAGPGARSWALENVRDGLVTKAQVRIDLSPAELKNTLNDLPIPHERIDLTFEYEGVSAKYLGELPPILNGKGRARLRGDDFEILMNSGYVDVPGGKRLQLKKGRFFIPEISPQGPMSEVSVEIAGLSADALRVLDHPPLGYMTAFGLAPATVGGNATVNLTMKMPLLKDLTLDKIELLGLAKLTKLKLANAFGKTGVDDGTLNIRATVKGLTAKGKVKLSGITADLDWTENFQAGTDYSSKFVFQTTLNAKERARLGIDLSEFLSGPISVKLSADGHGPEIDRATIDADLSKAKLYYEPIGWRHASKKTRAVMALQADKDVIRLQDIKVTGPNLLVTGSMSLNNQGQLLALDLPTVNLGPINRIKVSGKRRNDGVLALNASAGDFDARPLLRERLKAGSDEKPGNSREVIAVSGKVRRAQAFNGETINNISYSVLSRGGIVESLKSNGSLEDSAPFRIVIKQAAKGRRDMRIDSGNAGRVLRAVDLYSKISGGDFRLNISFPPPGTSSVRKGKLKLKRFSVRNESAFREIPQSRNDSVFDKSAKAGNFDFNSLKIPFTLKGNKLEIRDVLLKGSAIGASAQGTINTKTDAIRLGGTLIPAYGLNSIVSHVPLIGDILAGGKGKGVFGVTFAVSGTTSNPRVRINPVSALAPGIFRRIFEFGGVPADDSDKATVRSGSRKNKDAPQYR